MAVFKTSDLITSEYSERLKNYHITYSNLLNSKIKEVTEEVIGALKNPKEHKEAEEKSLHWISNYLTGGLGEIVLYFQGYLLQDEVNSNRQLIVQLIETLVEAQYLLRYSFNLDTEKLNPKLQKIFQEIKLAATIFRKIIEAETVHGRREEFLNELCNLMRIMDCIKVHNKLVLNSEDVQGLYDDFLKNFNSIIATIDDECEQIVVHYVASIFDQACQFIIIQSYLFKENSQSFHTETCKYMTLASQKINEIGIEIQKHINNSFNIKSLKDIVRADASQGSMVMSGLEKLPQYKEMIPNVKDAVHDFVSKMLALSYQVNRRLQSIMTL